MEKDRFNKSKNVRRFNPEPLETSSRTNRMQKTTVSAMSATPDKSNGTLALRQHVREEQASAQDSDRIGQQVTTVPVMKTQRVLPQPTETSSRSSRKKNVVKADSDAEDNPLSHTVRPLSMRRTASPSRTHASHGTKVMESHGQASSQHLKSDSTKEPGTTKPMRRFAPEPIESMKRSRRRAFEERAVHNAAPQDTPRKFTPQLIETGKRSFRRAGSTQDEDISTSWDSSPHLSNRSSLGTLPTISDHPIPIIEHASSFPTESRFSYASLLQRQEGRRHSFRVPDLPAIPSNSSEGSDGSNLPSLSTSPSTTSQDDTKFSTVRNQSRESCDERFSNYLLSLAAQCAEKQLREQALAAFPNEQIHEPVSHFAIDGDEDSDNEDQGAVAAFPRRKLERPNFRRESTADLSWELEEMRRHKEVAESKDYGQQGRNDNESRFSAAAIAARQPIMHEQSTPLLGGWQNDLGLAQMRNAASPPMLGYDIVFPMSTSPQGTTCEDDDGGSSLQEPGKLGDGKSTGLWTADSHNENDEGTGLWMGLCRRDEPNMFYSLNRPGIVTPRLEVDGESYLSLNNAATSSVGTQLLGKPPDVGPSFDHIDKMLRLEKEIEREFHDGFVSQVYNYLSLGYPSLARYYDHELSKISGIPIEDLRKDDLRTDPMGYVGVPDPSGADKDRASVDKCMRWTALRLYIHEWARQKPAMAGSNDSLEAWGVRERRGSWAI